MLQSGRRGLGNEDTVDTVLFLLVTLLLGHHVSKVAIKVDQVDQVDSLIQLNTTNHEARCTWLTKTVQ
jgi:hypothetical protein